LPKLGVPTVFSLTFFTFRIMITKVAIVTGGNKGVGFAIVKGLAKSFDGDVYLTARSEQRGQAAVKELEAENLKVKFHQLDIDDEASIKTLADFVKDKYTGLDLLVNNAAIAFKQAATDPFALQAKVTVATNYFSVKSTCDHLFPLLRSGARVVNVSSSAGFLIKMPSKELRDKFATSDSSLSIAELDGLMNNFVNAAKAGDHQDHGWPNSTYVVSKVGLSALTRIQQREMDKDTNRSDVVINHVHPGYVDTDMTSHKGPLTPDQGAKSSLFAASLPPNTDVKGQYIWSNCAILDWVNGPAPQ
jgi:carbonyl reductase 1